MKSCVKAIVAIAIIAIMSAFAASSGESRLPFTISISVRAKQVKVGDQVRLHVALTNVSDRTLLIKTSPGGSQAEAYYTVQVGDKHHRDAQRTEYGRAASDHQFAGSVVKMRLKPGEILGEDTILSKQFDFSSPGEYVVQLSRPVSSDAKDGVVKSNKIRIVITP